MKIKNIYKCLTATLLVLYLSSCTNSTDAEQLFDQTPTERLNAQKSELNQLLLSSESGWKAVYFTDNTILGGYTHLFKFAADGTVEMASDFDTDTDVYKSEYQIQLGSTVSLVFTTKNRIHLLSESDNYPVAALRSKGYLGDFQFLYYGQENGEIIFRGNRAPRTGDDKTPIELRFVKATAQDWADLPKNFEMVPNIIGNYSFGLFRGLEKNDGTTKKLYDFNPFSTVTRWTNTSDSNGSYPMGIGYDPKGMIVSPAVEVGGQKLSKFTYNAVDGSFTATGTNGVSAAIKYSNTPFFLTDDYKALLTVAGKPQVVFGYIDANLAAAGSNSAQFKTLLSKLNATLPANQKLSRIQMTFNNAVNGSYIQYLFNGGKATITHFVTTKEDAVNKTIILTDAGWLQNAATIAFLKDMDAEFTNPKGLLVKKEVFKITFSNTVYTFTNLTSNFRMTTYQL